MLRIAFGRARDEEESKLGGFVMAQMRDMVAWTRLWKCRL